MAKITLFIISLIIIPFQVSHGSIQSTGYVIDKIAYLSDCNNVSFKNLKYLKKLLDHTIDCDLQLY